MVVCNKQYIKYIFVLIIVTSTCHFQCNSTILFKDMESLLNEIAKWDFFKFLKPLIINLRWKFSCEMESS